MKYPVAWWAVVLGALRIAEASAQPAASPHFGRTAVAVTNEAVTQDRSNSLEGHLALSVAERLLASDDSGDRVRAVERLAASGQREGIDRLLRALSEGGSVLHDPRARLVAIRGLFPYASREPVRQMMEKAFATEPGPNPLSGVLRDTAAMALAASDDARSLAVLRAALRQGGAAGEAAERALLAYPPVSLAPLGVGSAELPAPVCELLGRLGDMRAVAALRSTLLHGLTRSATPAGEPEETSLEEQSRQAKIAAGLALARLGDHEQVAVARTWVTSGNADLQLKGAEILLQSGAADARRRIVPLLAAPEPLRTSAFRLAAEAPGPDLLAIASDAAARADEPGRIAVAWLGRIGGATAATRLGSLLREPGRAWDAAFALALAPGDEARRVLDEAMSIAALSRLAARAGVVRALALDDEPRRLGRTLRTLFASTDPSDRAAGAFGLAVLGQMDVSELVRSRDAVVVRAAARASLALGFRRTNALAERLATESDVATRTSLAIVLAGPSENFDVLPTYHLLSWAESDDPIFPLAIVAAGAREQAGEEKRLVRWMESEDPVRRAHAAFALARSPLSSAAGRLADAWRFEPDAAVRRAMVVALAVRPETLARSALEVAAKLDTDSEVRESAALGLLGRLPSPFDRRDSGCERARRNATLCHVAWISLVPSATAEGSVVSGRRGSFVDASGISLPVVSDPDGALVVAGVSAGAGSFRLASSVIWYEALVHDRSETGSGR
jgi:hypothetical protein